MERIIVVGASQGGVHAIRDLVRGLPTDFPAPLLVVLHVGASPSILPAILNDQHRLPAAHAVDGERIQGGHIYVAPPDHHLLVVDAHLELSRGPRENWARPAVDPLFRSAAEAYGEAVVGVVLTGGLNDGASGLFEIKRRGGVAIVQDPDDAEAPAMPQSALDNVAIDYRLPVSAIAEVLVRLASGAAVQGKVTERPGATAMAQADRPPFKQPRAQTCPECGGALFEDSQGSLTRFRCHIGHAMTAEVLAAAQLHLLERSLDVVLRTLNERAALCRHLADKHAARGDAGSAAAWRQAAEEARRREQANRDLAQTDWRHPESGAGAAAAE